MTAQKWRHIFLGEERWMTEHCGYKGGRLDGHIYWYLVYIHFYNIFLSFSVLPLYVHIDSVKEPLSAERVYDIHCISFGSRPSALVTWWSGMTQLLDHSSQVK